MGSIAYNHLTESILFNDSELKKGFPSLSDDQIRLELEKYRNHIITNQSDLILDAKKSESTLKVLSNIEKVPYNLLKQGALYFDQFVIYDPLFIHTETPSEQSKVMSKHLGFQDSGRVNRQDLVKTLWLMKKLTPMVASDYVKVLPMSYAFEAPEYPPIHVPTNAYEDIIPQELLNISKKRAVVRSMHQTKGKDAWIIMDGTDLTPGIFISFEGSEMNEGSMYHYVTSEVLSADDETRTVLVKQRLADYPMDQEVWDAWVKQSINKSAGNYVDKLLYENKVALGLGATYLTDSTFSAELLGQELTNSESIEKFSAQSFLNLELPFLDEVNIDKLMDVRTHEEDVFTNFRIELESKFRELRTIKDPEELRIRQENILHELGDTQVKRIDSKLRSLKKSGRLDGILLLGGLAGTVQTSGLSLLASAVASVRGYKSYKEYKDKLVDNPAYLLWKVLKK